MSPNLEETSRQIVESSQQSLRAASTALQAAYRRIRQIRRSLDLSNDSMPSPDPMGPNHSALLLTASPIEDEGSDAEDGIDFSDRQARDYPPFSWSDHQPVPPPPPRSRGLQLPSPSPSTSEPLYMPLRFGLGSHAPPRNQSIMDDAATLLGRNVAQREAAGPSSRPLVDPGFEHEMVQWRNITRRTDPGTSASRVDALSRSELMRNARSLDTEPPHPRQQLANISTNVPHAWPPRNRWRVYRPNETRQGSNSVQSPSSAQPRPRPPPTDRLSLLSNFSTMQNLATPTSTLSRDRPLLFEEPQSYINSRRGSREMFESPAERNYFIHRRLNADGDELVHNINLDWDDDDPLNWIMPMNHMNHPPNPRRRRQRYRITNTRDLIPTPPSPEPRRRGWARLDQDGNAIPSDEEEELERERAEYRVRAMQQTREANPDAWSLATRPTVSHDEDGQLSRVPRVHLNAGPGVVLPPRTGYGSVLDSVLAVDNRRSRASRVRNIPTDVPYGSAEPFVVNPLPMPLPLNKGKGKAVNGPGMRVSSGAAFAGR
ncbi:hypothetical protein MIND_00440800 [Mycena indigotica]|uniref:Uncharacterized protein n=1 Tax=Mycena indigotica TaxID=2126181 RepID=A0A8H6SWN2_9AGAR|nr:uncharacterized protein MIND_00440800 [Mycena indigotica]KAF7306495.1 hypothetical protein MIND_00440800 [Mycena indigotica]